MSKIIYILLVAAIAVAGQGPRPVSGAPLESNKLEAAARSGNWDEFNKMLSQKVQINDFPVRASFEMPLIPSMPSMLPVPNITFPQFPATPSLKDLEDNSKMGLDTNFSSMVISSRSFIIDDKVGDNSPAIQKFSDMKMPSIPPMPTMPPMPPMPPVPTMMPMPDITFPPFPKVPSFKEFEDKFGDNPAVTNDSSGATSTTTSVETKFSLLYCSIIIALLNHLNKIRI